MSVGTDVFNPSYVQLPDGSYVYNGESQNPNMATAGPNEQAAQQAWFAANPAMAGYAAQANAAGPQLGVGGGALPQTTMPVAQAAPGDSQPPSGLPTPAQISATAPAPIQSFGGIPSVTPTYADPAQQGFATTNAALVDPNQNAAYIKQFQALQQQGLDPLFQQQQQQLADQNAARGITRSGAGAELTNDLYAQQAAVLAQANAPIVQQGYGYTQSDIAANQGNTQQANLSNQGAENAALGANAGYAQQAALANQGVANNAAGTNANYYASALGANYAAYNNWLAQQLAQGSALGNENLTAYYNSYNPNSGVTSAYDAASAGAGNAASNAFGQATSAQGAALGGAFSAFGTAAGGGAFK